ncbi:MAG TPA: ABC transporter permease [Gammaproteobacteria bacterium]|nr:ABC transporter permease [Gammaproteobacteria bacterium]
MTLPPLRAAARSLLRRQRFTVLVVAVLALGAGATIAMFALVYGAFVSPLPYPEAERLVWLSERNQEIPERQVSYPNFLSWQERSAAFELMAAVKSTSLVLRGVGDARMVDAQLVTADYFRTLGVAPLLGRDFTAEDDVFGAAPTAIVSYAFWQRELGGAPDVIGRELSLDGTSHRIVGVAVETLRVPGRPELWTAMGRQARPSSPWFDRSTRIAGYVLARVRTSESVAAARADMRGVEQQLAAEFPIHDAGNEAEIRTFRDRLVGDLSTPLWLCFGAVGVLLLIVCSNVASLLLIRVIGRRRELALRAALGAGRAQLIALVLAEGAVLVALGVGLGLPLAVWIVELAARFAPEGSTNVAALAIQPPAFAFAGALALVLAAIVGLVPAWQGLGAELLGALGAGAKATDARGTSRLRNASIVLQTSLAVALLVAASLLADSLLRTARADHGFDADGVLTFDLLIRDRYRDPERARELYGTVVARLRALPGAEAAAVLNELPGLPPGWQTDISPEATGGEYVRGSPGKLINVDWGIVSGAYFATMRIPLLRGRSFTEDEAKRGAPVMVIDEALAKRYWPAGDALGRHIKYDSATPIEIVGVAADVRTYGDNVAGRAKIYTPYGRFPQQDSASTVAVRTAGIPPESLVTAVRGAIREIDPGIPVYGFSTLHDELRERIAPRAATAWIVGVFAGLAVFLAAVGVHGLMSYVALQRVREAGIRIALGARPRDVLALVVRHGLVLSGVGIGLGMALGAAASRLFAAWMPGGGGAPGVYVLAGALFLVVTAAACFGPARRAAAADPMRALREE